MFDIFKKSSKRVKVIDKVWLSQQAKWNACAQMVKLDPSILLVAWFEETFQELANNPGLSQNVVRADNVSYDKTVGRMVVFAEHYALASGEENIFAKLQLKEVPVLSSLEEPFFMQFGGQNTIDVIKKTYIQRDRNYRPLIHNHVYQESAGKHRDQVGHELSRHVVRRVV